MSTRRLEIFVAVCRSLNMSKTAQSFFISQSSVSQAITALEKHYNVILFERLNHKLYLTEAGKTCFFSAASTGQPGATGSPYAHQRRANLSASGDKRDYRQLSDPPAAANLLP